MLRMAVNAGPGSAPPATRARTRTVVARQRAALERKPVWTTVRAFETEDSRGRSAGNKRQHNPRVMQ